MVVLGVALVKATEDSTKRSRSTAAEPANLEIWFKLIHVALKLINDL
jgi:hypothetical protein